MSATTHPSRPDKLSQKLAREAVTRLDHHLHQSNQESFEVDFPSGEEHITLPREALVLFQDVLRAMAKGQGVSIIPLAAELTTQAAADMLGCSRPHLVKLLEEGKLPFTKVGRHRRVRYEEVVRFGEERKAEQRRHLIEMMEDDEAAGLYDTGDHSNLPD